MSASTSISAAIRAGRDARGIALVGYLTAGFPDKAHFRSALAQVSAACDVVEVGVPFSDPMADGATIQRASAAALVNGVTLPWILEELTKGTRGPAPVLLMSYMNPLMAFGLTRLCDAAEAAGVAGLIVPDLPFEESRQISALFDDAGLALITMVTPVTPPERLKRLCAEARGFVYAVTMTGITGKTLAIPEQIFSYLQRVTEHSSAPVCAGFGIRSRAQVDAFAGRVEGVIVGSALVEVLEQKQDPSEFLGSLRRTPAN